MYRIVPSRFPPVGVFDEVADADELWMIHELEARTNERLADPLGRLSLVAPEDVVVGAGTTPVMAAFTHPSISGSRFSDGTYGVYYAGESREVAIAETSYHRARFLRATNEPAGEVPMRVYIGEIRQPLRDGLGGALPAAVLDADDYSTSQAWGRTLRDAGAYGLAFSSIRSPGGRCVALFRPPAIGPVRQGAHLRYCFDGERITACYQVSDYQPR